MVVFTNPPPAVQRVLLAVLAPIGRLFGYRATYAAYGKPHGHTAPDAKVLAAAGLPPQ